ncbi:hypothetical protein PR003_g20640 [Phytophthora rubi]|uniref:GST N-terminal domain-containing protein n=1 Tax=Phytophthora rubi TaxID=129364 RepID=A0A6A4DL88_9STRA|nr:hypothetical protein PR003_g20640 [Phytophthora rubi]
MTQPQLKLTYFDIKGRAELTRLIFHYGGVTFTDNRVARADFPALKPTLPFGQVPALEVNGTSYAQSMAVARYAAKLSGLYPSDPVKALKDADKKAQKQKLFVDETAPKFFTALEIKWGIPSFTFEAFPKLADVVANVTADPKIAVYLAQQAQK